MISFRILFFLVLIGARATMGGCAWMPANGPSGDEVHAAQQYPESIPFELVKVTPQVERVLAVERAAPWGDV